MNTIARKLAMFSFRLLLSECLQLISIFSSALFAIKSSGLLRYPRWRKGTHFEFFILCTVSYIVIWYQRVPLMVFRHYATFLQDIKFLLSNKKQQYYSQLFSSSLEDKRSFFCNLINVLGRRYKKSRHERRNNRRPDSCE